MNATPSNRWKTPWRGPRKIFAWFVLLGLAGFVVVLCLSLIWGPGDSLGEHMALAAVAALGLAVVGFLATVGVRWLCCWRRFRWVLFGGACLITLFALAHAVENWRGHHAWRKFQQQAAAQGERFDLVSIIPPAVSDAENFAMAPIFEGVRNEMDPEWRRAHAGPSGFIHEHRLKLSPYRTNGGSADVSLGGWQKAERTDLRAWQTYYRTPKKSPDHEIYAEGLPRGMLPESDAPPGGQPVAPVRLSPEAHAAVYEFPIAPQPQSPAADVLLALSKFDPAVEELREASRRPHSRFPVRYEDGFNMLLPHLAYLRGCGQLLALRALAELDAGQPERALADVKLSLRLVDSVRTEPILISHLVRIALIHIALHPIWEGLTDHRWTDAQLVALEAELARLDFLEDYQTAMRGERVCSIWAVDYLRRERDPTVLDVTASYGTRSAETSLKKLILSVAVPGGWFDQNKVMMGRLHLELFKPAVNLQERTVSPTNLRRLNETLEQHFARRTPYNFFSSLLLPALGKAAERFARAQVCVDLARVACALERHRLAHGQFPQNLDALVPQFIPKLPHDVINGQPLKYRRTDDGQFLLYSIGWNESDDSGEIALTKNGNADWSKGDWVWRYPVK